MTAGLWLSNCVGVYDSRGSTLSTELLVRIQFSLAGCAVLLCTSAVVPPWYLLFSAGDLGSTFRTKITVFRYLELAQTPVLSLFGAHSWFGNWSTTLTAVFIISLSKEKKKNRRKKNRVNNNMLTKN